MERLQKILAQAGIGSRRKCEMLITAGHITVDGKVVRELGISVDPEKRKICCDGIPIKEERKVYYLLNKPKGFVCTSRDELGRPRAIDLLQGITQRVYTVGRLDVDSEGLIILTNDGLLANALSHPRYGVPKTYLVEVGRRLHEKDVEALERGIWLSEGKTRATRVRVLRRGGNNTLLEITLREGRNREVRRILTRLGYKVRSLRRTRIGWLFDPSLKLGRFRRLTQSEVARFYSIMEKGSIPIRGEI
ncbi:MAG TPA: pseudouridine synthase [Candidatus Hypogeohydataceae bacterium YC38]|nr:pseudouridine synthase [Candidatus Brocadiales bacterium]